MLRKYKQLSVEERETIQIGLWQGKSLRSIANELSRSPATISRELKRNCPLQKRRYTPRLAQEKAKKTAISGDLNKYRTFNKKYLLRVCPAVQCMSGGALALIPIWRWGWNSPSHPVITSSDMTGPTGHQVKLVRLNNWMTWRTADL